MAFDATDYTGLIAWWRPDTLGLSNGANVTSLTDASGNGLHLTPPGTAPTYDTDEFHGLGVVRYDGTSGQKLTLTDASLDVGEFTLFVVAHIDVWEQSQHWLVNKDASNPSSIGLLKSLNNGYDWLAGIRLDASPGTFRGVASDHDALPAVLVHELSYDGSTFTYRINGVTIDTLSQSGAVDASPSGAFVLGGHPDTGNYAFDGWFGDVVYYDNALSSTDRDQAVSDLLTKWLTDRITTEDASNPIWEPTDTTFGSNEENRTPRMVLDGSTYYMVHAYNTGLSRGLTYATSPSSDPFNFTASGETIVVTDTAGAAVVKDGSTWYVFVDDHGNGGIDLYTGSDLDSLSLHTANIISNIDGSTFTRLPSTPIEVGGTWYMLVDIRTSTVTSGQGRIDLYSASALDGTWTRDSTVLSPSGNSDWEDTDVSHPDWILVDGTYYMVYAGYNNSGIGGSFPHWIGLATSTDRTTWTKHAQNPVIWTLPGQWTEQSVDGPGLLDDDGFLQILAHGRGDARPAGGIGHWTTTIAGTAVTSPPATPTVTITSVSATGVSAETSIFVSSTAGGSHVQTDWRLTKVSDATAVTISSTTDLTSIVDAGSTIPLDTDANRYTLEARHGEST